MGINLVLVTGSLLDKRIKRAEHDYAEYGERLLAVDQDLLLPAATPGTLQTLQ